MPRQRSAAVPLLSTALLLQCLACAPARHTGSMIRISESAASHPTELSAGDQLEITLAENITTGYSWKQDLASCAGALRLDSDKAVPAPNGPPGAGGHRTWVFTALREARCELHFRSERPWEKTATGSSLVFPIAIHKAP